MSFADQITRQPIPYDTERGQHLAALFADLDPSLRGLVQGMGGCSPYLSGLAEREADWLRDALADPALIGPAAARRLVAQSLAAASDAEDADALGRLLRQAKRRVALFAGLADLGGVWSLDQVTTALTLLGEQATDLALRLHVAAETRRGKLPASDADAGGIFALAMGKMGAYELNYSSDIDLIVLFDDAAYDAADRMEARAALIRATRKMAATLSDITADGYVFRTDLRLRPDASVTPVCISASAALAYYEAEGRTWERAAYIKARPCAGDIEAGQRFLDELRPFVWRRHLDFAAIQDAHDMRLRIRDHKGLHGRLDIPGHNMKLGQGGIREIEFFTQTRQLIAGGRDPELRLRGTVEGLAVLARKGWVPQEVADRLTDHYVEHREIEHRVQMVNDAQTHLLPTSSEGLDRIARMMGQADTAAWATRLRERLAEVEALTSDFFTPEDSVAERPQFDAHGEEIITGWLRYPALRSARAQQIFRRIEGSLLGRIAASANPDETLARFDAFLAGLPAGVQLFSLFEANPQLVELLVDICGTAPGLAGYLSRHPGVLDAVLGGSFFDAWPGVAALTEALAQVLQTTLNSAGGGYEQALDAARRWAHEWQFRTGVHHLRGLIGAEEAGGQYADIADAAIRALLPLVSDHFAERHGTPPGRGAVVVGMGSLGARQLNAASDLDLIVIYDADASAESDGKKPLSVRVYYARLTQAIITALSAPTAEGRLFEVDMRLRPSGRQGPVATSLQSFRAYQMDEAWTWEHLALTRARVVAVCGPDGDTLADDLEALRVEVLRTRGGDKRVLPDLAEMRARIFAAKSPEGPFEVKIGPGRLQDIDLLAQACALIGGEPARAANAQLRAGKRHGLMEAATADQLAATRRQLWEVQAAARLLSDRALTPETLGRGGCDFLLRQTGADSIEMLAATLHQRITEAADLIAALLPEAAPGDDAPGEGG
ncbi:MAG: bifunctional [glutamine synthetase] adenylyltransferase/[glutamine synthetase]-adenylyl-L-tyrosine phosphorylase [Paracoccus sp. (in: a-proteobacteria)]|uniref:bifunctional [glutamine synthetase] adenylyltransferase/[glutamine synthetase]-adenylyl-L-tyrosine phosphorylase n=1 Tax=Paracoccus sp. TaxID=267 RepID=UPI0026E0E610|nr:bifunctional [glutamine synthetase] adenylyltransferase/[glutamine synthetase]-adenylyl-L-tyrosine phosphorylase [Paracoccus sp. (in: a-proteobacteria)]MDO5621822.1 bifunctional [glutamine synthetase] adenylyltransferase/[glutamine synthetase]-adenylyl-L-tyrosine phosphorylase [Paracoccus sp. (in: a-proteobacteria)]